MCRAVTVWSMCGAEERRRCECSGDVCFYHAKIRDGLLTPLLPDTADPNANRPVAVELDGREIWTLYKA